MAARTLLSMRSRSSATQPIRTVRLLHHSTGIAITATRIGWCSGSTTEPARIFTRSVTAAIAALVTDGFGYSPPNAWKCRSGVQTAAKPC